MFNLRDGRGWPSSTRGVHGVFGVGVRQRRFGIHQIIPNVASSNFMYSMVFNHGALRINVDGSAISVPANTLFIWDVSHRVFYGVPKSEWVVSWLQCYPELFDSIPCRTELPLNEAVTFNDAQLVDHFFWMVHEEFLKHRKPDAAIVENAVAGAALTVRRETFLRDEEGDAMIPAELLEMHAYLQENFKEKISLDSLARRAKMAPAYLSRRFKKFFGVGPIDWLIERRLSEAAIYLKATDLRVQEIACLVGFGDIYHFSKSFRKRYGSGPREFRQSGQAV